MSKNKSNINAHTKLGKFYKVVLKILTGKEMMTDGRNDRQNDGMTGNPNLI